MLFGTRAIQHVENTEINDFRDFRCLSAFCDFLLGLWDPGGAPLDPERNFDPPRGLETPGTFFWTHFRLFLNIFWIWYFLGLEIPNKTNSIAPPNNYEKGL